eukprot:m.105111 g.105111  ORF g.105111 m.105111 type:complete len:145 (+) comp9131_c0_seq1:6676-7110(+)
MMIMMRTSSLTTPTSSMSQCKRRRIDERRSGSCNMHQLLSRHNLRALSLDAASNSGLVSLDLVSLSLSPSIELSFSATIHAPAAAIEQMHLPALTNRTRPQILSRSLLSFSPSFLLFSLRFLISLYRVFYSPSGRFFCFFYHRR